LLAGTQWHHGYDHNHNEPNQPVTFKKTIHSFFILAILYIYRIFPIYTGFFISKTPPTPTGKDPVEAMVNPADIFFLS
jgi:hypothetical protein